MTATTAVDRPLDVPDWFAGVDERIPVPLLRHVADSRPVDLGPSLAAAMEMAHRRTGPAPTPVRRPYRRRAVVEPAVLPRDIGRRFLVEFRDLTGGGLPIDVSVLAGTLAVRLEVPATVARAALAVVLTVTAPHEPGAAACCAPEAAIPSPRPSRAPVPALVSTPA